MHLLASQQKEHSSRNTVTCAEFESRRGKSGDDATENWKSSAFVAEVDGETTFREGSHLGSVIIECFDESLELREGFESQVSIKGFFVEWAKGLRGWDSAEFV